MRPPRVPWGPGLGSQAFEIMMVDLASPGNTGEASHCPGRPRLPVGDLVVPAGSDEGAGGTPWVSC